MKRRAFITLVGSAAAWPIAARAQQPERVRRIGYLSPAQADPTDAQVTEALRQVGRIEGMTVLLEIRHGENDADRLAQMAAELVRLNVDVIVARGTLGPLAAKQATATIPREELDGQRCGSSPHRYRAHRPVGVTLSTQTRHRLRSGELHRNSHRSKSVHEEKFTSLLWG